MGRDQRGGAPVPARTDAARAVHRPRTPPRPARMLRPGHGSEPDGYVCVRVWWSVCVCVRARRPGPAPSGSRLRVIKPPSRLRETERQDAGSRLRERGRRLGRHPSRVLSGRRQGGEREREREREREGERERRRERERALIRPLSRRRGGGSRRPPGQVRWRGGGRGDGGRGPRRGGAAGLSLSLSLSFSLSLFLFLFLSFSFSLSSSLSPPLLSLRVSPCLIILCVSRRGVTEADADISTASWDPYEPVCLRGPGRRPGAESPAALAAYPSLQYRASITASGSTFHQNQAPAPRARRPGAATDRVGARRPAGGGGAAVGGDGGARAAGGEGEEPGMGVKGLGGGSGIERSGKGEDEQPGRGVEGGG